MSKLSKYILCLIISYSALLFSQNSSDKVDLVDALKLIETRFIVKFSYADKDLKNIKVFSPSENFDLSESLNYLSEQTGLNFNALNNRFIAIQKPKQTFNLQRLDEVFIENYLTEGLSKSINGTLSISPQEFGILPGLSEPDVFQTIQTLPGIISADERISNLNIRGGTNDQNLVLYNGIRMYQNGHFFGLISAFNPYLLENIDVIVNGTPTKYGTGVSSLISLSNSNEISEDPSSGAGFNLLSFDGFSKFQLSDNFEVQVAARRSYTDALLTPTYNTYFERIFENSELENSSQGQYTRLQSNERFFFYDANIKLLYNIDDKNKIRANVLTIYNSLDYDVIPSGNGTFLGQRSELSQQSIAGNIEFIRQWSPSLNMNSQLYYSNYKLFGDNNVLDSGLRITQENIVDDLGIRMHFTNRLDKNVNLNFGYQFNSVAISNLEDVINPNFRRFVRNVVNTHGIYTEAEFTSNSKNTYGRLGVRGNYISDFKTILFEPRFSFSQKFFNYFRLELLGEVKSQTISQIIDLQQDFFGIEKRRWQLADDNDFPITKSDQISLGLNYKRNGLLISIEAYNKNVRGINSRSQGFQNQFQLVEAIGNYNIKGIDFLLNRKFNKLSTWFSYSFSDNDFEFDESTLNTTVFPNNLDIQHVFNVSSSFEVDDLKISAGLNWHSGRAFTELADAQFTSGSVLFDTPNAVRIDDYMRVDVSAIYKFKFAKEINAEVGFSVWNVFDERNIVNRFYTRDGNNNIVENNELALGISPNFSLRFKF